MIFARKVDGVLRYDGKNRRYNGFEIGVKRRFEFPIFSINVEWFVREDVPANHWSKRDRFQQESA